MKTLIAAAEPPDRRDTSAVVEVSATAGVARMQGVWPPVNTTVLQPGARLLSATSTRNSGRTCTLVIGGIN